MYKLKKAEKDKLRKAIKKKRRRMRGKKLSIQQQAALKKQKILQIFKDQEKISKLTSQENKPVPVPQKTNENNPQDTPKGVTANDTNNSDYVEFEDLKPEYQELVEKFIRTDRDYMRQLEEEQKENKEDINENEEKEQDKKENTKKEPKLSKRKLKKLKRIPVAQLKVLVDRPDLVESWDVTAKDPLLLMWLKSYKNTVVVPKHWSQKRKFLQNKRGRQGVLINV
jgi:splicing factor 3B subunit 2